MRGYLMQYVARNLRRDKIDVTSPLSGESTAVDRVEVDIYADEDFVGIATFVMMWSFSRKRMFPGAPGDQHGVWLDRELLDHLNRAPYWPEAARAVQEAVDRLVIDTEAS